MRLRSIISCCIFPMLAIVANLGVLRADVVVDIDSARRTTSPGGFTTYFVKVTNTSPMPVNVRVRRMFNTLPDTTWETSICSETHCYAPEEDVTGDVTIASDTPRYFKVHVQAGKKLGDSGVLGLRFESTALATWIERTLSVTVVESPLPAFTVDITSATKYLEPGEENVYPVWLENPTSEPVLYRVRRIENILPDTSWHTWLCVEDTCYAEDVNETPKVEIPAGGTAYLRLGIIGGSHVGDRARIVLRFDSGDDAKLIDRLLQATIYSTSGVPTPSEQSGHAPSVPFPIPASTSVTIPIPHAVQAGPRSLALVDAAGHRVADFTSALDGVPANGGMISVDVKALPSGVYRALLQDGAETSSSTIIVQH